MNTRDYSYIITIAAQGSIKAAADQLGISSAALSKFLKKQQETLGIALFFTYRKRLYLTEAGRVYCQMAHKILTVQSNMLSAIRERTCSYSNVLRIAVPPNLGFEAYTRTLHRMQSIFPNTQVAVTELYSQEQENAVEHGLVDMAFGVNLHTDEPNVQNIPISKVEILLAMSQHLPLARQQTDAGTPKAFSISELRHCSYALSDKHNNVRKTVDKLFAQAGFMPIIVFESASSPSVEFMIRSGAGIGFMTSRHAVLSDEELAFFHLQPRCYENYYLRCSTSHSLTDEEQCFAALYIQELTHVVNSEPISNQYTSSYMSTLQHYSGDIAYAEGK